MDLLKWRLPHSVVRTEAAPVRIVKITPEDLIALQAMLGTTNIRSPFLWLEKPREEGVITDGSLLDTCDQQMGSPTTRPDIKEYMVTMLNRLTIVPGELVEEPKALEGEK